jgi:uncharacterized protein (DUF1800 family)
VVLGNSATYQPISKSPKNLDSLLFDLTNQDRLYQKDKVSAYFNNWIDVFVEAENPIREWATLFWHEFIPCTGRGQKNAVNLEQNYFTWELYRRNALGSFRQLLVDYFQNPSSMYFLDIHRSHKDNPNENFARELLELYTLGPGNYSEKDVKEIARCFTGLHYDNGDTYTQKAYRNQSQFDSGSKKIFGKTGNFYPEDVFDLILEKEECAEFVAGRAIQFFIGEGASNSLIKHSAKVYYQSNYNFEKLLESLFNSGESQNPKIKKIKSPIEHLVFLQRDLGLRTLGHKSNAWFLRLCGQYPLSPWSVKGWTSGMGWLQSEYLMHRAYLPLVLLSIANRKDSRNNMAYKIKSRFIDAQLKEVRYTVDADFDQSQFRYKLEKLGLTANQYLLGDTEPNDLSLEECLVHPRYQYLNKHESQRFHTA